MKPAETVVNVIRERGERGLPLENIYRLLYNRELYLRAYGRLYSNQVAMTKGTTAETVGGMSLAKIDRIIDELRYERFRWTPVRRVNLPKPNGGTRPLGIPIWTDKLLQEVIRIVLEAYYEPQFSDHSHGFRPDRGCHTALGEVVTHWTGVRSFVEGDIKGCFDNIDNDVMLSVLGEKLHDNRFLNLLKYLLKAGYMEDWHPERYAARRHGQPHPCQHLPRPVGQIRRKGADSSTYPWHSPKSQPSVECVEGPNSVPEGKGELHAGGATAQADATTPGSRSSSPWILQAPIRSLRRRLRVGLQRAKSRSRAEAPAVQV